MGPRTVPRYTLRPARLGDLDLLSRHRIAMYRELRAYPPIELRRHEKVFRRWVGPLLRRGELLGIVAEDETGAEVASGCVWFQPVQPRPSMPRTVAPYVLSMYTLPEHRRRSLATRIIRRLIEVCRRRGYPRVVLHASHLGRPVYERLGFEPTTEMRLWLDRGLERQLRKYAAPPRSGPSKARTPPPSGTSHRSHRS